MTSDTRVFVGAGLAALASIAAALFIYMKTTNGAIASEDGAGPNLVIEVAGESASGIVVIDLLPEVAPNHVAQLTELARTGAYDGIVFHRVIDGFMAQTGDVQHGKYGGDVSLAGTGKSELPNIPAEFSDIPFMRGVVGMARSNRPDSANSQFFIMFEPGEFLNGKYTVVGHVISGMEVIDAIKKGDPDLNGAVENPDRMQRVTVEQ
ncbi:Peptidyl-prolyl cis-trans isomerase B [Defluviimonas aquaemixtae]|uniref:Peptidyl-prolyl cis-trans isomerase n=1 Tax=Albidovulum aquaemixtae TaxID=1542388 RepID=A0A2R8B4V6_9RHOB|nr:peptidylprolyl isomerase [Defluviimonas aquaemixtae]SPH17645.1 Peptidyl-prolyl cis-trans isomerase B [Defluviimonas aquaemixtae]